MKWQILPQLPFRQDYVFLENASGIMVSTSMASIPPAAIDRVTAVI